jgi:hypothetical protein
MKKHTTPASSIVNAKLFLAGKEPEHPNTHDKTMFDVFECVMSMNHYPLTWSEEKRVANLCRTSSTHVSMLARALIGNGWKPSTLTLPITRKLNSTYINTDGQKLSPPQ